MTYGANSKTWTMSGGSALPRRSSTAASNTGHSKVPEVTLGFWLIKVAATTLGETGGDAVSMTLKLGYAVSTLIFVAAFVLLVGVQVRKARFEPFLYWTVIVSTTTAGTTMADYADRSLGVGYIGGSLLLFGLLLAVLGCWYWSVGSIASDRIASPKVEMFYWAAILSSNTLGTALGDFLADRSGLGYEGGALVFAAALLVVAGLYAATALPRALLFWAAFILTRPLGATMGDLLTKPHASGGLALSRVSASEVLAALMLAGILLLPQRAGGHPGSTPR